MKKRIFSLLLVLAILAGIPVTAFAADASVTYSGHKIFDFAPGSEFTKTDLFDNFKNVMPGDVLTQKITVKNTARCCDYIKVYIRAELHDEENPLSPEVARHEDLVSMADFLSQLSMTVEEDGKIIYEASPDEVDGFKENVYLGKFRRNKGTELTVQLKVPLKLGNEYANRVGEVDWVFTVVEYKDDAPKTGDDLAVWRYAIALGVSVSAAFVLLLAKRRRKETE